MLKDSRRKIKKWLVERSYFLGLAVSIFLACYFPAISRYNANTLFNSEKRGFFGFLFFKLNLKRNPFEIDSKGNELWIREFGVILFTCYVLRVFFSALSEFLKAKSRESFKRITDERFGLGRETEWTKEFSNKIVNDFSTFFSHFCELFVETWAILNIFTIREFTNDFKWRAPACLAIVACKIFITKKAVERRKTTREKSKLSSFFLDFQEKLMFSESNTIFTAFYLVGFPNSNEVVNAVLLGLNINSLLGRGKRLLDATPETILTYKMWRKTENFYTTKKIS